MAPSLSRRRLTNAQKLELCEFSLAHRDMDPLALSIWAANHFQLALPMGTRTVQRILSSYGELRSMAPEQLQHKTKPNAATRRLDAQLRAWIITLALQGLRVNGDMIKHEAARIYAQLSTADAEGDSNDPRVGEAIARRRAPVFSNGWLSSFLERNSISLRSIHNGGGPFIAEPSQKKKKKNSSTSTSTSTSTTRRAPTPVARARRAEGGHVVPMVVRPSAMLH